jgi:hypothetical protein
MKAKTKLKLAPTPLAQVVPFDRLKSVHAAREAAFMVTLYISDGVEGGAQMGEFLLCETKDGNLSLAVSVMNTDSADHVMIDRLHASNVKGVIGRVVSVARWPYDFTEGSSKR